MIKNKLRTWLGIEDIEDYIDEDYNNTKEMESTLHVLELRIEQLQGDVLRLDNVTILQELDPHDWVQPRYYLTAHNITVPEAEYEEFASKLYGVWRATHHGKEPTRDKKDVSKLVYPVDFISSVINGKYDHIKL